MMSDFPTDHRPGGEPIPESVPGGAWPEPAEEVRYALRRERDALRQELDEALADHARLQGRLSAMAGLEDTLRQRTLERDEAREALRQHREQAAWMCERLEQGVRRLARSAGMSAGWAAAREPLRVILDEAQARIAALEEELRKSYRQLALRTAEMDALRHTAASQVAAANVHAGTLEHRVAQLEAALEITRVTGRAIGTDAGRIGGELAQAANALRMLAERQSGGFAPGEGADNALDAQEPLFNLDEFNGPVVEFDASASPFKPAHDPRLLDVIEEAFNPRPEPKT